ncbi:WbqC family protein [Maridesulfovibrio sp.]|uniref:WbqC family protein n=1 Tax=Maridesulfovibrio sp. TaxID=2795000 RepID=UPI0029C9FD21|nr:WbqC family protein [Maridesulfovibrio sp.]
MKVAMMQPAFLPWQGFFALIQSSDLFIFLDDFQFSIQSHHQRNKLLIDFDTPGWYTVTVKKKEAFQKKINEVSPFDDTNWRVKTAKRIQQNYGKSTYFKPVFEIISRTLEQEGSLAEINIFFIKEVSKYLGWEPRFINSSSLTVDGRRSERVINLLKATNATEYLSAYGSFSYMQEDHFVDKTDIIPFFLKYEPGQYAQSNTQEFISHLSIADALFNIGPQATAELIEKSTSWLSWQEMAAQGI